MDRSVTPGVIEKAASKLGAYEKVCRAKPQAKA
jgi:hypothetical protein